MNAFFDSMLPFDLSVFEWVQSIQNPVLSAILVFITHLGEYGAVFLVLGAVLFCTKKFRKLGIAILGAIFIMEVGNNFVFKLIFARPRPFNLDMDWWNAVYQFPDLVSRPNSFSFPSGHAASAFAAAFTALWYNKKFGIPMTVFACVMAFSRVYVEVHYCTDVLFGVLAGLLYAVITVLLVELLYPRVWVPLETWLTKKFKKESA